MSVRKRAPKAPTIVRDSEEYDERNEQGTEEDYQDHVVQGHRHDEVGEEGVLEALLDIFDLAPDGGRHVPRQV